MFIVNRSIPGRSSIAAQFASSGYGISRAGGGCGGAPLWESAAGLISPRDTLLPYNPYLCSLDKVAALRDILWDSLSAVPRKAESPAEKLSLILYDELLCTILSAFPTISLAVLPASYTTAASACFCFYSLSAQNPRSDAMYSNTADDVSCPTLFELTTAWVAVSATSALDKLSAV